MFTIDDQCRYFMSYGRLDDGKTRSGFGILYGDIQWVSEVYPLILDNVDTMGDRNNVYTQLLFTAAHVDIISNPFVALGMCDYTEYEIIWVCVSYTQIT